MNNRYEYLSIGIFITSSYVICVIFKNIFNNNTLTKAKTIAGIIIAIKLLKTLSLKIL